MKNRTLAGICLILLTLCGCQGSNKDSKMNESRQETIFTNPLLPVGAEPWATFKDGYYYYMHGMVDKLVLWKTKDITDLRHAPQKTIWEPKDPTCSHNLWGPEIHFIDGKWYVYYAADDGNMDNHQIYVLENSSRDPFKGEFIFKGRISTDKDNNWAIHPNVIVLNGVLYMTWSGWQARRVNVEVQCIYIAKMKNPWTLASERVLISKPELEWERQWINPDGSKTSHTIYVNEAPQFFYNKKNNKIYIFYSASGNWTPFYALGQLAADVNSDLLNAASWTKSQRPVFKQSPDNKIFAPGNCSFVPSPDGKECYMLYHARKVENEACGALDSRSPRLQKIGWNSDGAPCLGDPIQESTSLIKPSGLF